jgi:hypothetical protein
MKNQPTGSGGFGGAITSMIAIVDICPTCHRSMSLHPRRYPFGPAEECPERIVGAFPFIPGGAHGPKPRRGFGRNLLTTSTTSVSDESVGGSDAAPPRPRRATLVAMTMDLAPAPEEFL